MTDMQCPVYRRVSVCQCLVQSLYRCTYNCSCHMINWAKPCFMTQLQVWAVLLLTHPWPWISTNSCDYIYNYYVYPLVHAGEASVGVVVGPIISVTTIVVVITIAVALVTARKRKAKKRATFNDLKATVSVDKYSIRIRVYCIVYFYAVCTGVF